MKYNAATKKVRMFILGLLVLFGFGFLGCSTIGTVIPQERRITLANTQDGASTFKEGSLSVNYSYSLSSTDMNISGNVSYMGGADSLDIRVVFLDSQGAVVDQKLIYATAYRDTRGNTKDRSFEKSLEVPAGVVSFSFTYSAQDRNRR